MKSFGVLFLCCVLLGVNAIPGAPFPALGADTVIKDYHGRQYLDWKQQYLLEWTVDWPRKSLLFNISVRTTGWVGFGFSKDGLMKDADLVVVGVNSDQNAYLTDYHTDCHRNLIEDNKQDWNLLSVSEMYGVTTVQISRPIDTCDTNDYSITEDLVYLLWAYGETDTVDYHHQECGSYQVYLLDPVVHPAPSTRSLPSWRVANVNFTIPAQGTSYWCSIHKAPQTNGRKQHFIQFEVILENTEPVARQHVHHFLLWKCFVPRGSVNIRAVFEPLVNYRGEECYFTDHNVIPINLCRHQTYVWALGARPLVLPGHVGIPFGDAQDEYYMLEVHYDNPESSAGITFTAGVQAWYTDRLRPVDGGSFTVNHDLFGFFIIPPGSLDFKLVSHCSPACTSVMMPPTGICVFAVHAHTHRSGAKAKLHHFRHGKELPWMFKDDNYDFNFQMPRPLQKERKILPGDHLTAECDYKNTWSNGSVFGGPRSEDEMCLFVMYHTVPIPYSLCLGALPEQEFMHFVGVNNFTWDFHTQERVVSSPPVLSGRKVAYVTDNLIKWSQSLRHTIAAATLQTPQVVECPRTIPLDSNTPNEVTLGNMKQFYVGAYSPPNVAPNASNLSTYPLVDHEFHRARQCPVVPQAP